MRSARRETIIGIAFFILGLVGGMAAVSSAQTVLPDLGSRKPGLERDYFSGVRIEAAAGVSKHRLAPEGSWHYDGFKTSMRTLTASYMVGAAWFPIRRGNWHYGVRGGYADLGKVTAENDFPVFEDRSINDARVNPNCNTTTFSGCTGRFRGHGQTKGFYLGLAAERDWGAGVGTGLEGGLYAFESNWRVEDIKLLNNAGEELLPPQYDSFIWDHAKSKKVTPYVGANLRWREFFISARLYSNVRAGNVDQNPDYRGPTTGPLWSVLFGYAWSFGS